MLLQENDACGILEKQNLQRPYGVAYYRIHRMPIMLHPEGKISESVNEETDDL